MSSLLPRTPQHPQRSWSRPHSPREIKPRTKPWGKSVFGLRPRSVSFGERFAALPKARREEPLRAHAGLCGGARSRTNATWKCKGVGGEAAPTTCPEGSLSFGLVHMGVDPKVLCVGRPLGETTKIIIPMGQVTHGHLGEFRIPLPCFGFPHL